MKNLRFVAAACAILVLPVMLYAATPEQVGSYAGTVKWDTYDQATGEKTSFTNPAAIDVQANNTMVVLFGNVMRTSPDCPIGPQFGGFEYQDGPATSLTIFFKISHGAIKGTAQYAGS